MSSDDEWMNAIFCAAGVNRVSGEPVYDSKPFLNLLRRGAPVPAFVGQLIADLYESRDDIRKVVSGFKTPLKQDRFFETDLPAVLEYLRLRGDGWSEGDAFNAVQKRFKLPITDLSHFHAIVRKTVAHFEWLLGGEKPQKFPH